MNDVIEEEDEKVTHRSLLKRRDRERKLRPDLDYSRIEEDKSSSFEEGETDNEEVDFENLKPEKRGKLAVKEIKVNFDNSNIKTNKNAKNEDKSKILRAKEDSNNDFTLIAPENPDRAVPKSLDNGIGMVSRKHLAFTFFNEYNETNGLIDVSTNLRFFGLTLDYEKEQDLPRPLGYKYGFKLGFPIFKDDYEFPTYKSAEAQVYKKKLFGLFDTYVGLQYAPIYSVNVPHHGGGLQVFENNIFWAKAGLGIHFHYYKRAYEVRFEYAKSTFMIGNYISKLDGQTYSIHTKISLPFNLSLNLSTATTNLEGDLKIKATHYEFSVGYVF